MSTERSSDLPIMRSFCALYYLHLFLFLGAFGRKSHTFS